MTEWSVKATTSAAPAAQSGRTERFTRQLSFVIGCLLAAMAMVSTAVPAFAHTSLVKSYPADGAVLTNPPDAVTLTFDGVIQPGFAQVVVLDAEGTHQQRGEPRVDRDSVTQSLATLGEGSFRVSYRVVAADGHPVTGTLTFSVGAASDSAESAPSAAPLAGPTPPHDDGPEWALISTGIIVVAAVSTAIAALVLRRARWTDNGRAHVTKPEDASEEP